MVTHLKLIEPIIVANGLYRSIHMFKPLFPRRAKDFSQSLFEWLLTP